MMPKLTVETIRRFTPEADFGEIIRFLTRYRTRADLADDLGVSRWSLYAWENGKSLPDEEMREKLFDLTELRAGRLPASEVPMEVLAQLAKEQE
jgi:transcriptional regulator with XRE-family HTH domain